jgi:hypothetical protein
VETTGAFEHGLRLAEPVGQRDQHPELDLGPGATGSHRTSMSSSAALPQTPHEEVA